MGVVLLEGFARLPASAGGDRISTGSSSGGSLKQFALATGAFGGKGLLYNSSTPGNGYQNSSYSGFVGVPLPWTNTWSMGFALRASGDSVSISYDTVGFSYRLNNLGSIYTPIEVSLTPRITVGAASAYSNMTAPIFPDPTTIPNGWHWYSIVANMGTATGGYFRVYRNMRLAWAIEGDTLYSSAAERPVRLGIYLNDNSGPGNGAILSDIIVHDDLTIIPPTRVDTTLPTATLINDWDGSDGDRVDNHSLVADNGTLSVNTYVESSTVGATDLYTFPPLPYNQADINQVTAVQVRASGQKSVLGPRTVCAVLNNAESVTYDLGGNGTVDGIWGTNPAGGTWDVASVNASSAGVRIKS